MSAASMLAYVFWHTRRQDVTREEYEQRLFDFHKVLRANAPAGAHGSRVLRLAGAPWLASAGNASETYEDWYFLEDSAGLDRINEAAVSGARQAPHDGVARLAAAGIAGLYRIRSGKRDLRAPRALWFSKPGAMSYAALAERFQGRASGEALWMRQMTLGPTPEFCLQSGAGLPDGLTAQASLAIEATWDF